MVWMIHSALPDLVPIVEGYSGVVVVRAHGGAGQWVRERMPRSRSRGSRLTPPNPERFCNAADEPLKAWLGQRFRSPAGSADRGAMGQSVAIDHEQVVLAVTPIEGVDA